MSKSFKKKSIAEKISDFLEPKALLDPEKDLDDSNCRFSEFDKESYDKINEFGQIRKRNTKSLDQVDSKYKGVLSRRDIDDSDDGAEDDDMNQDGSVASSDEEDIGEEEESVDSDDSDIDEDEFESGSGEEDEDLDDDGNMFATDEPKTEESTIVPDMKTNENYQKSVSVKNQLEIWEKLLEVRIKSQKLLLTANSLPLPQSFEKLSDSSDFDGAVEETFKNIETLLTNLQDFQHVMCSSFPETKDLELKPHTADTKKRKSSSKSPVESKKVKLDNFGAGIEKNYTTLKTYSQPVLQKWHDRTNVVSISKTKQLSNSNLIKNIEDSLINKPELIKKTQIYRGGYDVFDFKNNVSLFTSDGKAVNAADIEGDNLLESVNKLVCPEIFDDSDFYHQLLRELIQSKSGDNQGQLEITKKYHELQKLRRKMKKTVDTRASKGRKIRYVVHSKMMNFMASSIHEKWSDESKEELYNSLFGQADKMK